MSQEQGQQDPEPVVTPDWKHRADYIRTRSTRKESSGETNIEPEWADEAFTDPQAVVFSPDPASKKGQSDRTIGWSETAGFLVTVITVAEGTTVWGANAWKSNDSDQRRYQDQILPAADNKNNDVSKKEGL